VIDNRRARGAAGNLSYQPCSTQPMRMTKYGDVAVRAARILKTESVSALEAWHRAAAAVFPAAPSARAKTCPREAFLGLYYAGLLRDSRPSSDPSVETRKNRQYALVAVRMLRADPQSAASKAELWRHVMEHAGADPNKRHNGQLDVVLALHDAGLMA
jgi:hypothetical protein